MRSQAQHSAPEADGGNKRTIECVVVELVLLSQGPAAGDVVTATGPTLIVGAHLYDTTGERAEAEWGRWRPVYRHIPDCCDHHGGGQGECDGPGPFRS